MDDSQIFGMIMLAVGVMLYFLPLLVANSRGREGQVWIGFANLILGWTIIGWIVLLVIAFTGDSKKDREYKERMLAAAERQSR